MRRMGGWRFEVALLLGLGLSVPVLAQDPAQDPDDPPKGWHLAPWLQKQFEDENPNPKPKPKKPAAAKPDPAKPAASKATPPDDPRPLSRDREERDFLRRLAVCDQLLKIAQDTRDEQLERKAQQLNDRAWAIYRQRVAQLPAPSERPESDAEALQRYYREGPTHPRLTRDSAMTRVSGIRDDERAGWLFGTGDQR
jgi:hypothetical protein